MRPNFTLVHIVLNYLASLEEVDVSDDLTTLTALQNDQAQLDVGNIPTDSDGNPVTQATINTQMGALWTTVAATASQIIAPTSS